MCVFYQSSPQQQLCYSNGKHAETYTLKDNLDVGCIIYLCCCIALHFNAENRLSKLMSQMHVCMYCMSNRIQCIRVSSARCRSTFPCHQEDIRVACDLPSQKHHLHFVLLWVLCEQDMMVALPLARWQRTVQIWWFDFEYMAADVVPPWCCALSASQLLGPGLG